MLQHPLKEDARIAAGQAQRHHGQEADQRVIVTPRARAGGLVHLRQGRSGHGRSDEVRSRKPMVELSLVTSI